MEFGLTPQLIRTSRKAYFNETAAHTIQFPAYFPALNFGDKRQDIAATLQDYQYGIKGNAEFNLRYFGCKGNSVLN